MKTDNFLRQYIIAALWSSTDAAGVPDKRYTIGKEWTGAAPVPQFVARFCGTWISGHGTIEDAEAAARAHELDRSKGGAHGAR